MSTPCPPKRESVLGPWSTQFGGEITAAPTAVGLTVGQAADFEVKRAAYAAAYAVVSNPGTRTQAAVAAKNLAKVSLTDTARMLIRIIQAHPGLSDEKRLELGIPVRNTVPTPIGPPTHAPGMGIVSANRRTVRMRLHDVAHPTRRGKPPTVIGASVFSYVGPQAPTSFNQWHYEGNTSQLQVDVVFPETVAAGSKVWFTALWYNAKFQNGPCAEAISADLPGGSASALA